MTPSAGPSSPSPAELAAEALRDFLGQDWCAGAETRLQALVRSVEERTLGEAAEAIPSNWLDPMLSGDKGPLKGTTPGKWGCKDVERLLWAVRSRLASLKETRER